ncbi:rhomboid family intramembrane serine protease [Brevirhabdus pacifica]|uniref:Rhomboid family intramembrane serine protease n=1 Tax=Brevirhabdus pacifica TaxID=1267768 RepID=A0A1U7DJU2_9RHOB|nr:rhomboid family intramembrane serine protease [Brevirhabdus pacifica]APX90241.1 rhomboid family intramembrane serine protease [Brevirhabdus pacifica]PJJ80678.1 membrane associated rhomboid family serine protease [Brevirhabdus pacifica]
MNEPSGPRIFHALPPVIIALAVIIGGIEGLFWLGEVGLLPGGAEWRTEAVRNWGFFGELARRMIETGDWRADILRRFVSYPLIHQSMTHALFAIVFVLAIGNMVAHVFRPWAVLAIFFASSVVGALVYGLVLDERFPLIGGYPGVYGLIGAYTFLLWVNLTATGGPRHQAFILIGMLLGIQLAFSLIFDARNDWVADIAGFAAGFAMSFVVSPGGGARVIARLRRR